MGVALQKTKMDVRVDEERGKPKMTECYKYYPGITVVVWVEDTRWLTLWLTMSCELRERESGVPLRCLRCPDPGTPFNSTRKEEIRSTRRFGIITLLGERLDGIMIYGKKGHVICFTFFGIRLYVTHGEY